MFISEAEKFLSASNNVSCAKTFINECKRLILDIPIELPESTGNAFELCKKNINECNIDSLVTKIEETKQSLIELDQSFASEYMTLLSEYTQISSIDTESMTDEQRLEYNIKMSNYYRDYNYMLLYMLEGYEESGMLTPDLEEQLEIQRTLIAQYELQDDMSILSQTCDEYIEKYKTNAELDRRLIELNPNLSDEEKKNQFALYDEMYNNNLAVLQLNRDVSVKTDELNELKSGSVEYMQKQKEIYHLQVDFFQSKGELTKEEQAKLDELLKYEDLMDLYIQKDGLENNWIPFDGNDLDVDIMEIREDLGIATQDEIEYLNMNWFEKGLADTTTFIASTFNGIFSVEEQIIDGFVTVAGALCSRGNGSTEWAEDFIKIDFAGESYQGFVSATDLNSYSAYGNAHVAGNFVGEMMATISLQFLPGGTPVMVAAHGLKGTGSATEDALNKGVDFDHAAAYGIVNGSIEATSSYLLYGKGTYGSKYADKFGKSFLSKIPYGKNIAGVVGKVGGKLPVGMQNYFKSVLKPSLVTKLVVSGGKEYAKEANSVFIDGDFDLNKANSNAVRALTTQMVNEFIVAPLVAKVTSPSFKKNVSNADKEYYNAKKSYDDLSAQKQILEQMDDTDAKSMFGDAADDIAEAGVGAASTHTTDKLASITADVANCQNVMNSAYNDITLFDELFGREFVSKFVKKASGEWWKETYNNYLKFG